MNVRDGDGRPVEVLLVDDAPGDVRLTLAAFRDVNEAIHLHVVGDGMEALPFLRREGPHVRAPRPDLILLDLNLPRMDGRDVLAQIKADDTLRTIPIVIKPVQPDELMREIRLLLESFREANSDPQGRCQPEDDPDRAELWLTKVSLPQSQPDIG